MDSKEAAEMTLGYLLLVFAILVCAALVKYIIS